MNTRFPGTRLSTALVSLVLGAAIGMSAEPLRAEDAKPPAPDAKKPHHNRQDIQDEIAAQPEGIHAISDGSVCIKSGHGMAIVHAGGHGCGTGMIGKAAPANADDIELMAGIFYAFYMKPQEATKIGIAADQAAKIKDAYNYMDHMGTHPGPVLKIYEQYSKAAEGNAKTEAEKALMDKVRAVGQAYIDGEAKKLTDVKALLTPDQANLIRAMGFKFLKPNDKQAV